MRPQHDRVSGTEEGPEAEPMYDAAEALREADVEAAQPGIAANDAMQLDDMSIDDLRKLAAKLDVPNCEQIVEQDKLIRAIRRCL